MRSLLLAVCLLITADAFAAPPNFIAPFTAFQANVYLHDVVVVDLDTDGSDDVVVLSDFGFMTWWRGDGTGWLEVADTVIVPTTATYVRAADLNADEWPDLVTSGDTARVFLGVGLGALAAPSSIGPADAVWMGQVVGDGSTDLVAVGMFGIRVYEGDGAGGFGAPSTISVASVPSRVLGADWDGDGTVDLAVLRVDEVLDAGVGVFMGVGNGTFAAEVFHPILRSGGLEAADFDEDSALDLVVGSAYLPGDGTGGFGSEVELGTSDLYSVVVTDLDGDGHLDLAGILLDGEQFIWSLVILLGNGGGAVTLHSVRATGFSAYAMSPGDLDRDGRPDLVIGTYTTAQVDVYLTSVTLPFGGFAGFPAGSAPADLATGDLTGDLVPDVVVAASGSSSIRVIRGVGDGTLGAWTEVAGPTGVDAIDVLDVDADGTLDIACASSQTTMLSVFRGTGGGGLAPRADYVLPGPASWLDTGDLDGNGRDDIVVYSSGIVSVFLAGPAGVLGPRSDHAGHGFGVAIARINADAFPDVVLPSGSSGTISWYPGSATGALGSRVDVLTTGGSEWFAFAVGDIDGDGDDDVVRTRIGSFVIAANDGLGGFASLPQGLLRRATRIVVGDLNDDAIPDLAAVSNLNQCATALYGMGGGVMSFDRGYGTGHWPEDVELADMNSDGHPDMVVANRVGNSVSILRNTLGGVVAVEPGRARPIPRIALDRVFPSPARARFEVAFSVARHGHAVLEILDVSGRRVHRSTLAELAPGRHARTLDRPPGVTSGVYWVVLRQGQDRVSGRVVFVN